jgi:DNA-binding NtrC family response regulator
MTGAGDEELARLNLVGESAVWLAALRLIRRVAACDATVLIEGETGTGKELVARAIHYLGARRDFPFIPLNCGALPDNLIETELFGYERGAFTDAKERRHGLVAEARGGTLFLDEVEAMSPRAQVVLLRFLQDQKYLPIGGRVVASGDLRVVAASNADLGELAERNLFRRDLLFRLRVLRVRLPPLRERTGDVRLLADTFVERHGRQYQRRARRLTPASLARLEAHDWPGNVRELESLILREVLLHDGDPEELEIGGPLSGVGSRESDHAPELYDQAFKHAKAQAVAQFERSYLRRLLAQTHGNVSLAARISQKDRSALNKLVKKHGLRSDEFSVGTSTPTTNQASAVKPR